MTHRKLRSKLVERIKAAGRTDQIHAYERFSKDDRRLRELYEFRDEGGKNRIKGGFIVRVASKPIYEGVCLYWLDTWQLRLYMALADQQKTELLFDDWLDAVTTEFECKAPVEEPEIFALLLDEGRAVAQVLESEPYRFAGMLCHAATIEINTSRRGCNH